MEEMGKYRSKKSFPMMNGLLLLACDHIIFNRLNYLAVSVGLVFSKFSF